MRVLPLFGFIHVALPVPFCSPTMWFTSCVAPAAAGDRISHTDIRGDDRNANALLHDL